MEETYRDRVAALLKAQEGRWIDARDIARIGGHCGWRTRLSECRRQLGMPIGNRVRKIRDSQVRVSEYRYQPGE